MLRLYQFEISPFCDKIRRSLRYKGVPFEVVNIPVASSVVAIRRVNPVGKLPCLDLDGRLIADSTNIAEAIEDAFPDPPLYPSGKRERALVHVLEDWADESLYYYEMRLRFGIRHNAARWVPKLLAHDSPVLARLVAPVLPLLLKQQLSSQGLGKKPDDVAVRDVARHVRAIESIVHGNDWLVGSTLTIADLAVFAQMHCIRGAVEGRELIDASPGVTSWMARVDARTS